MGIRQRARPPDENARHHGPGQGDDCEEGLRVATDRRVRGGLERAHERLVEMLICWLWIPQLFTGGHARVSTLQDYGLSTTTVTGVDLVVPRLSCTMVWIR